MGDFPGTANAGKTGSIPGSGKTPCAVEQLLNHAPFSLCPGIREAPAVRRSQTARETQHSRQ